MYPNFWERKSENTLLVKSKRKEEYLRVAFKPSKGIFIIKTKKYYVVCGKGWITIYPVREDGSFFIANVLVRGPSKMKYYHFLNVTNDGFILSDSASRVDATVARLTSLRIFS